jgi:Ni,Fe-hydrogenase I cytochrome b subunit
MFDSLDEQIKHDEHEVTSNKERILRWVMVLIVSVLVFGGLYFGVRLIE